MFSRWSAIVGVLFFCLPLMDVVAGVQPDILTNSQFRQWNGYLQQSILSDRSTLSEYIAQTVSDDSVGASLRLAFAPRFNCTPMLSIVVSSKEGEVLLENPDIKLYIDALAVNFPAIIDHSDTQNTYSYGANNEVQHSLRLLLDRSSYLSFQRIQKDEGEGGGQKALTDASPIVFSLLGSRKSVAAVEKHCKRHKAIPFDG